LQNLCFTEKIEIMSVLIKKINLKMMLLAIATIVILGLNVYNIVCL
jgi:hypothetical protein